MKINNPSAIERYYQTADLLLAMEAQLRLLDLWEAESPPIHDLESQEPFCVDTLRFTQWMQFILIPRLKILIEEKVPLPGTSNISVYAAEALNGVDFPADELLRLIQHLDNTLTAD